MKTIHHVVDIDGPTDSVWSALTEGPRLASWWSTRVETAPAALGVQTHWTFGGDFNPVMQVTEIVPRSALSWRCIGGHDNWQDNDFRFELVPLEPNRTRLRFWQEYATELSDDDYGIYNFNWGYYLESLRLLCPRGRGRPYVPSAGPT